MAAQPLLEVSFERLLLESLRQSNNLAIRVVWPSPGDYTRSVPVSTGEDGFWWIHEDSVPVSSRRLFADASNEGAQLCKYLMSGQTNKKAEMQRIRCLRRLSISLMKILFHQEECDLDYGAIVQTWIEQRWALARDCMVRFCLAEKVYAPKPLEDLAAIPFSIPLQSQFIAACERTYPEFGSEYDLLEKRLLIGELEKPGTPENMTFFPYFIRPILLNSFPAGDFRKESWSLFMPTIEDSFANEYSIFQSPLSMLRPPSPEEVESMIPTLRTSHQPAITEGRAKKHQKPKKNSTHDPCYLQDQSRVNAEQIELCKRSQLLLQHYDTLYTFLKNWWSDSGPGQEDVWSQSHTGGWIDLTNRKCVIVQNAAWFIILGTESLWERCELHRLAGNFDEDEGEVRLLKLKRWMVDILVLAVSVHIDGWRTYKKFHEDKK